MSHVRFSQRRRFSRTIVLSVGFGSLAIGYAFGQEGPAPVDRAWDAIRREADANRKQMAARFARVKALGGLAPAPVPMQVQVGAIINRQPVPAVVLRHGPAIALMEEIAVDPDADVDAPAPRVRVYTEQAFDFYAFGDTRGAERMRFYYDALLQRRIDEVTRTRLLADSQIKKLRLAGRGDIKRRFDEVDSRRREFAVVRMDPAKGAALVRDLIQFRATQVSMFEEGSLFAKVLNQMTQSTEGSRPEKPLPGSQLTLDKALERANVIVAATNFKSIMGTGNPYSSIWCADATVTHSFKGDMARGVLRLNAIPLTQFEALPTAQTDREFLLFIERTEGNGLKLHRVIKMLPTTKDDVRFVEDVLNR